MLAEKYGYLIGTLVFLVIWTALFLYRKDLRKEMLFMSSLIGILSVITAYWWWTVDWWLPPTLTGTRVGIEDFLSGFTSGGIMAVIYEEVFKKRYYKRELHHHYPGIFTILLLLAFTTSFLFWGVSFTSFFASTIAMAITAVMIFHYRRDLFYNGVFSGILMVVVSLPVYYVIIFLSPSWIEVTYYKETLSNIRITGIPIEELIFWFMAGLVFGPLYEYWQGFRLQKLETKTY